MRNSILAIWNTLGGYGIVALIIVGAVVYVGFLKRTEIKEETMVVHPGDFLQQVSVSGRVTAANDVDLGFSQSGRIAHVYKVVGDNVSAGTLLAEIENGD